MSDLLGYWAARVESSLHFGNGPRLVNLHWGGRNNAIIRAILGI
ncbi:hypothetical protein HMPREF9098_1782 [Kingella denitrificans ATCC 33394]|uniref:Uncharacterized protein n=1 Tax=Kingella denitrificans ATCC 33394 TaxID=888741 RepID=F0F0Z7_9NEIS|nr:hypothetical protein HMPREF9098_1782 [Kingella denitrificans ATCC 33394]